MALITDFGVTDTGYILQPLLTNRWLIEIEKYENNCYKKIDVLTRQAIKCSMDLFNKTGEVCVESSVTSKELDAILDLFKNSTTKNANNYVKTKQGFRIILTPMDGGDNPYYKITAENCHITKHNFSFDYSLNDAVKHNLSFRFDNFKYEK